MDVCGFVLASKDALNFGLKCLYCEEDVKEWDDFVLHIKSLHSNHEEPVVESEYRKDIVAKPIEDELKPKEVDERLERNDANLKAEIESDDESMEEGADFESSGSEYAPSQHNDSSSDSEPLKEDTTETNEMPLKKKGLSCANLNPITETFIEVYASFPVLYDSNHKDYNCSQIRKQTFKQMADIMKSKQNVDFTENEVYKGIHYLRHWYNKKNRLKKDVKEESLSDAAKFYLQKCNFFSTKKASSTKLKCPECDKLFEDEMMIEGHLYREHNIGQSPYKCSECGRTFLCQGTLDRHELRHMGEVHKCNYCEQSFAVQTELQRHLRTHPEHKPFVCELCGMAYRAKANLVNHTNSIHKKLRAFKCTMCPKDFLRARDLKDHIKSHLNIRDKICETCGKGFTNCHSLGRHRQIHSEVKKFACKLCDAKYHQFVGLNSHMKRTHGVIKNQQTVFENKLYDNIQ